MGPWIVATGEAKRNPWMSVSIFSAPEGRGNVIRAYCPIELVLYVKSDTAEKSIFHRPAGAIPKRDLHLRVPLRSARSDTRTALRGLSLALGQF